MNSSVHSPELELFVNRVVSRLGFNLDEHNAEPMQLALRQALERTGSRNLDQYLNRFENPAVAQQELRQIAQALTVPETYFFRYAEQFRALAEIALPERMKAAEHTRKLNLLSAGCASGEEAYSLAAILLKIPNLDNWQLRILGVDVNTQLLAKASQARYSDWSLRAMPESERAQYFQRDGNDYLLHDNIKRLATFEESNLLTLDARFWQPDLFDIIFCRNVMIYFSPAAVRALVARLTDSLAPGGFLFLGPSETLRGLSQAFHLRHTHGAFYYQRKRKDEPQELPAFAESGPKAREPLFKGGPLSTDPSWVSAISESSRRIAALADHSASTSNGNPPLPNTGPVFPATQDIEELHELFRQERFDDALRAIDALSGNSAADADVLMLHAVLLANRGELDRALQLCEQLLARDELRPGAHYLKAICHERRGDHLTAAEHDLAAIYLDPKFAMPRLHLGLLARRLGALGKARQELTDALALLAREDAARILLFGGGFSRNALIRFCQAQLELCGGGNGQ